ncbi:hypothetical protein CEXT_591441 [Caerostris extrusa]|uniref:Uncharacterized protein n=1 Tax=Caerostris extrusa TaxID=172846 RepID=A0AAV4TQ59_CAEEX|nr:hypothetical protein CEXT_591441 [Caerostris extrusa]
MLCEMPCVFLDSLDVVRAAVHGRHPAELRHPGAVPSVRRRPVRHPAVPPAAALRRPHLRLLRLRDARQGHGHGGLRPRRLPRRHLEQARLLHRAGGVSGLLSSFSFSSRRV